MLKTGATAVATAVVVTDGEFVVSFLAAAVVFVTVVTVVCVVAAVIVAVVAAAADIST